MKTRFIIVVFFLAFTGFVNAQAPHSLNYQSVVRNSIGEIEMNKLVSFRISILKGSATGSMVYSETHKKVTNEFGLVTLEVGNGTVVSGVFNNIDWGSDIYFLKTEFDINGGTSFSFMGTSQLLYVPYAIYAEKAGNAEDDHDKDSINELQTITKVGNNITLSQNGGTITDSDNQTLSLNGNQLTISTGNTVTFTGAVDLDANPTNELQNLTYSNDTIQISQGNNIILPHDNDLDSTNEIQTISKAGNTITLSNNGGAVIDTDNQNLSSTASGTNRTINISNGTGTTINIADNDNDSINELQYLSYNNDTLYLSNGNYTVIGINNIMPSGSCITSTFPTPPTGFSNTSYIITGDDWTRYSTNSSQQSSAAVLYDSLWFNMGGTQYGHNGLECHNLYNNTYSAKQYMQTKRLDFQAVLLNKKIYVMGGRYYDNTNWIYNTSAEKYNISNNTWTNISSMTTPRADFQAFVFNNNIYVAGGYTTGIQLSSCEKYDTLLNNWTPMADMNFPRYHYQLIELNNKFYAIGGFDGTGFSNSVEEYDPIANIWVLKAPMNKDRANFSAVVYNGKIYVFGGQTDSGNTNTVEVYDPILNIWSFRSSMNEIRLNSAAQSLNNRIYVIGGWDGTKYSATTEIYNPILDTWQKSIDVLEYPKCGMFSFIYNNYIYIFGGYNQSGLELTNQRYVPGVNFYIHCKN